VTRGHSNGRSPGADLAVTPPQAAAPQEPRITRVPNRAATP
jgi:hypothetical protein